MSALFRNHKVVQYLEQSISIAPLVTFRIAFGLLMIFSAVRYLCMGWVASQLIAPTTHFSYYGFEWVQPLPGVGMYIIFGVLILSALAITLGAYYRLATVLYFLCFTYVELIDITYYLNHYYFLSIVSFLLIWVPAHSRFSVDVLRNPKLKRDHVPRWCIGIFKAQIAIVYIYAGLAKINDDWLIRALPLSIWLPAKSSIPIIGWIFTYKITAVAFSWIGMLFDTCILFFLMMKKTRWVAYSVIIIFHTLTGILFQIGVFPIVMIFSVLIFFSADFHERVIHVIRSVLSFFSISAYPTTPDYPRYTKTSPATYIFLGIFFLFQLLFPWRYLLYPGNIFWTEEGYRFAWRVMLMEKAGTATFYVKDGLHGREGSVINHQFLNLHQEKQMAMQPDLILQFAHQLEDHFKKAGMSDPSVRVEAWVTLNASRSKLLIDPTLDLTTLKDGWAPKTWILPFNEKVSDK